MDQHLVAYFKGLRRKLGIPYQRLINLNLRECAEFGRKAVNRWIDAS